MTIQINGTGTDYATIQEAIDAASANDIINISNGTYILGGTLNVNKDVTLLGESQAGVIIEGGALQSYGIQVDADGATLQNFTFNGPAVTGATPLDNFGIKVQPDGVDPTDRISDISIIDVTVAGSARSEIDINGGDGITITGVTVDGMDTAGNGISLTDTAEVTITDLTTTGNDWGSVALYNANRFYDQATGDINFVGIYSATELVQIYAQDSSNGVSGDGNDEVNGASTNLGAVTLPSTFANNAGFQIKFGVGTDTPSTFAFTTQTEAEAALAAFEANTPGTAQAAVITDPDGNFIVTTGMNIEAAVNAAEPGDTITVFGAVDLEGLDADGQVVLADDINIVGADEIAQINAVADTGSGGDARGMFLVNDDVIVNVSDITISGDGNLIYQGFRHKGDGTFDNVTFTDIQFQESGPAYQGTAIAVFGGGAGQTVDVINSAFSDIGRIGVLYFGPDVAGSFEGNFYTGKGDVDGLDYALDISAGATIDVINNTVMGNEGTASSDGSTSAAFLVSTFFGGGTNATFTDNTISDSTSGIAIGFNTDDTSIVEFTGTNTFSGTETGLNIRGNVTATGTDTISGPDADVKWQGGSGDNVMTGAGLDDEFEGALGADTIDGGEGIDTAFFDGPASDFTIDGVIDPVTGRLTEFTSVTDNNAGDGDEGTDTLTSVEVLDFADGTTVLSLADPVQLFDDSGNFVSSFTTIQDAVNAAMEDYTVNIAAGTYLESVTFDKALTFTGAGEDMTTVTADGGNGSAFTAVGDLGVGNTVSFDGIGFDGSAAMGINVGSGVTLGTLEVTNSSFEANDTNGIFVNNAEVGNVIVTDSTFTENGQPVGNGSGDGDLVFFKHFGDATLSNLTLTGGDRGTGAGENGIQFSGGGNPGAIGNVSLNNISIGGIYEKQPLVVNRYENIDGLQIDGLTITADSTGFNTAINIDTIGGDIDLSHPRFTNIDVSGIGTDDAVALQGSSGNNSITTFDEGSFLRGFGGNDTLTGGLADDTLVGDTGGLGGLGDTALDDGADVLKGGGGNDTLYGNGGDDELKGGAGSDQLFGGEGADSLIGGAEDDFMVGGLGDDSYVVGDAGDAAFEFAGEGTDTVNSTISYTLLPNLENLVLLGLSPVVDGPGLSEIDLDINGTGNSASNEITGNEGDNILSGRGGDDILLGGEGDDELIGGAGTDAMSGGEGDDTYRVESAGDTVTEEADEGDDVVYSNISLAIPVNVEVLILEGTDDLSATGSAERDILVGNSGNNIIVGGGGIDVLRGEGGDDVYAVDESSDAVVEQPGGGNDVVYSSVDYILAADVETLILTGTAVSGFGNEQDNQIFGNSEINVLYGLGGNDFLLGLGGDDIFVIAPEAGAVDVVGDFNEGDRIGIAGFGDNADVVQVSTTSFEIRSEDGSITQQFILQGHDGSALVEGEDYYFG